MAEGISSDLLHPLLAARRSPARFDGTHVITAEELDAILEAARWAPSAGNSQPWSFVIGRRGDATHRRLVQHLAGSSRAWAPDASLLIANLCHRFVAGSDLEYSEFAVYDLGQAVSHMTIEAVALGLGSRQFRAFDRDAVAQDFGVPTHYEVTSMTAIGRPLEEGGTRTDALAPSVGRARRSTHELRWPDAPGEEPGATRSAGAR